MLQSLYRKNLPLLGAAALGGALFFAYVSHLWPLVSVDLGVPHGHLESLAREFAKQTGLDLSSYEATTTLSVNENVIDYLEQSLGRERTQKLIQRECSVVNYVVGFKQAGNPHTVDITLQSDGSIAGWRKYLQDDAQGALPSVDAARAAGRAWLHVKFGLNLANWSETAVTTRDLPHRVDHSFTLERVVDSQAGVREMASISLAGVDVTFASRWVVVPDSYWIGARSRAGPGEVLASSGQILAILGILAAIGVCLRNFRKRRVRLTRATGISATVFACSYLVTILDQSGPRAWWDPLKPHWVSTLNSLAWSLEFQVQSLIVLAILAIAGESLDQEEGGARGRTLWLLCRGHIGDPSVAKSSILGLLVGLACGGVITVSTLILETLAGAHVSLQPRGFFLTPLNSSTPILTTLIFFLTTALTEEIGYRYFGVAWLTKLFKRRALAILAPAIIYGLMHSGMTFLPPSEPYWSRSLVMSLVGCVWGWAFLRFDALTVILSHWTADLFIFSWPLLARGLSANTAVFAAACFVPLSPFLIYLTRVALDSIARDPDS